MGKADGGTAVPGTEKAEPIGRRRDGRDNGLCHFLRNHLLVF
jgi:hypothetical protein